MGDLAMGCERVRAAGRSALGLVLVDVAISWNADRFFIVLFEHAGNQPGNLYWRLRFAAVVSGFFSEGKETWD